MRRTAALAAAALLATAPLAAGCSAAQKALDCGKVAVRITSDVQEVESAARGATEHPKRLDTALDTLSHDLDQVAGQSHNDEVGKSVRDLRTQVEAVRRAVDAKRKPDLPPLVRAAATLTAVCAGGYVPSLGG
ncbi:hypothetical protein ACIQGZ_24445 [Streptomyces sp. NPDC092296]|uniref:hypothetical protein n=1 Tax=Streptomyces sp. NPDC092296 TaxID=3366012 RepID=UPI00382D91F5